MVMTLMILLCVKWLYIGSGSALVYLPVQFSYNSAKFHPYTAITTLAFMITISVSWYPYFTYPLITILFLVFLIIVWLFAWYCVFMCWVIYVLPIVYTVNIACAWVVSQAVLICPLMDLLFYAFVVDLRGFVQLWYVLVLYVVFLRWLVNLFLWCICCRICHDDYGHLFILQFHGSTVPNPHVEQLQ